MFPTMLFISVFVLTTNFILYTRGSGHRYVIKKDFLSQPMTHTFSVFDENEQHLKYRIEARFHFQHNNEIIVYPSKRVVGKLKAQKSFTKYVANISLLDMSSNQWINGNLTEKATWHEKEYIVHWKERCVIMRSRSNVLPKSFYEQGRRDILARFGRRAISRWWKPRYDIEIVSADFPDALYFLVMAVDEYRSSMNT